MPEIKRGHLSCCTCHAPLQRKTGRSLDAALACSLGTLALLLPANLCLLLRVSKAGLVASSYLFSGVAVLWSHGWVFTAAAVAMQAVVFPLLRFSLLSAVLASIRFGRVGPWTGPAFRWCCHLDLWAMPDVFLLGFIIGYSRLAPFVPVEIGAGGWCLIGAALLTMLTRASHDRRETWRRIGQPATTASAERLDADPLGCPACDLVLPADAEGSRCPRCRLRIWRRRPGSLTNAFALVIAGFALYPIANAYPLSVITLAGAQTGHTLYSSVMRLVEANLWPLACVIFTTSIGIPLAKLVGLCWLFLSVRMKSRRHLVAKTRTFRLIDEIGRWSNADIFTLVVYMPLVQFGQLATVNLGQGAPALQALVIVTMLASGLFDQRLVWDPARRLA
ncbi:MAG: paraquat-inducible protein A [Proteobacteria bacterium]|nr:paraquat-inducible protein A [Pseudomonadota bacterium]